MFKKILVALDGSEHADHALTVALGIAEKYAAEIMLVTVFHPVFIPMGGAWSVNDATFMGKYLDELKNRHEHILADALHKITLNTPSLKVSTKLEEGRPADRIIVTAKEEKVDLIVMGSRGLGGIRELLLGSVSDRVADEAPCPVLIVR